MSEDVIRIIRDSFAYKYAVKHYLWEKQGTLCAICKIKVSYKKSTIDHIIPRSKGGLERMENYQVVHKNCNEAKADKVNVADIRPGITVSEKDARILLRQKKREDLKKLRLALVTLGVYPAYKKVRKLSFRKNIIIYKETKPDLEPIPWF